MPGDKDKNQEERIIDIDKLNDFNKKLKEYFPEYFNGDKFNHSFAADLYLDTEEHPEFYIDKELEKKRLNKLIEAEMYKEHQEEVKEMKEKAEDLSDKVVNNPLEEATGIDINGDGKIGDKKPVDKNAKKPEDKQEEKVEEQASPLPDILDYITNNLERDRMEHPEFYENEHSANERSIEVGKLSKEVLALIEAERKEHPEYYANSDLATERAFLIKNAIEVEHGWHEPDSPQAELAKKHPRPGLNDFEKTLTDLHKSDDPEHKGPDINHLIATNSVRDMVGNPFERGERPWDAADKVRQTINEGKSLWALDKQGQVYMLIPDSDNKGQVQTIKSDPALGKLVDGKIKREAVASLEELVNTLETTGSTSRDSDAYKELLKSSKDTLKKIKNEPFKEDFDKAMTELNDKAGQYIYEKAGQKKNARRQNRYNVAKDIKALTNAVQKDKMPSDSQLTKDNSLRFDIAANAVKTYANMYKDSSDPLKQALANHVLENKENFEAEVRKTMQAPGFVSLFGDAQHPKDTRFLQQSVNAKGKDVLKSVIERTKSMDEAEISEIHESQMRAKSTQSQRRVPVSPELRGSIKGEFERIKKDFEAGWHEGKPEFDAMLEEMEITAIRLETNSSTMNFRKQFADLADKADAYYMKKLQEGLNSHDISRVRGANKLRHLSDCLEQNKTVEEMPFDEIDALERDIAGKLVLETAKKLKSSESPAQRRQGELMLKSPKEFNKQLDKLQASEAFKALVADKSQSELESLFKTKPGKLAAQLGKKEQELRLKKGIKEKEKDSPDRTKEIEEATMVNSASAMFR